MRRELISGSYIQADETPVDVQTREGRGKNHQSYLWQYSRPEERGVRFPLGARTRWAEAVPGTVPSRCRRTMRRLFDDLASVAMNSVI
jgi:hypothetical protein